MQKSAGAASLDLVAVKFMAPVRKKFHPTMYALDPSPVTTSRGRAYYRAYQMHDMPDIVLSALNTYWDTLYRRELAIMRQYHFTLPRPCCWKRRQEVVQLHLCWLPTVQDRLDDIRCQQRRAQHTCNV